MKKTLNLAFIYAIAGLAGGVYFREFTKFLKFDTINFSTPLSVVHTHLLVMGVLFMLIVGLISDKYNLFDIKKFNTFFKLFNIGLIGVVGFMLLRGTLQVAGVALTGTIDGILAGCAGLFHATVAVGIVGLLYIAKKQANQN